MNIELYDKAIDAMSDRVARCVDNSESSMCANALTELVKARSYIVDLHQPYYIAASNNSVDVKVIAEAISKNISKKMGRKGVEF